MTGKSKEEIAFELVSKLKGVGVWGENNRAEILDMYADCLEATSGLRPLPGRATVAERIAGTDAKPKPAAKPDVLPAKAPVAPHPAQNQVPPAFQPPVQPQMQAQQPVAQPVHQQQQMVQQAYQQPRQA